MKKLILTLIACGIITGTMLASQEADSSSATSRIRRRTVASETAQGAALGGAGGALMGAPIAGVGAAAGAGAGAVIGGTEGFVKGLLDANTSIDNVIDYMENNTAGTEVATDPTLSAIVANTEEARTQFAKQKAQKLINSAVEQGNLKKVTSTDLALYYLSCSNSEEGCCVKKEKTGKIFKEERCTEERQKFSGGAQGLSDACKEDGDYIFCDEDTLAEIQHISSMNSQDKDVTLFGRAYEYDPQKQREDHGRLYTDAWTAENKERGDLTPIQSSAARFVHSSDIDFFSDPQNITAALSGSSTSSSSGSTGTSATTGTSGENSSSTGGDSSSNPTVQESSGQGNTSETYSGTPLTDNQITTMATATANAYTTTLLQTNAAILEEIRRRINEEADARRRERLTKVVNELDALQKSLSGSMDCKGADCYKVYDVGDENGKSVTGGQTLSNYIDIR